MSPTISRILLTIILFPMAGILNFVAYILLDDHLEGAWETLWPVLIADAFVVVYWLLLWRKTLIWTRRRLRGTLIAAGGSVIAAGIVAVAVGLAQPYSWDDAVIWVGCALAPLLWIGGTVIAWRETNDERSERIAKVGSGTIVCPACQYNLTGLREARCPECGAGYTLNELLAAQPSRATAEIEAG